MDELVVGAVREVFDTMLNLQMSPGPVEAMNASCGQPHIAGSVGFIGRASGIVYIHATEGFAREITATLLGMPVSEIQGPEMVNDAMGEMANMIVGHMKSRMSDRGMPCALTIPSVVRGVNFSIEAVSSTRGRGYVFVSGDKRLFAELLIKPAPAST